MCHHRSIPVFRLRVSKIFPFMSSEGYQLHKDSIQPSMLFENRMMAQGGRIKLGFLLHYALVRVIRLYKGESRARMAPTSSFLLAGRSILIFYASLSGRTQEARCEWQHYILHLYKRFISLFRLFPDNIRLSYRRPKATFPLVMMKKVVMMKMRIQWKWSSSTISLCLQSNNQYCRCWSCEQTWIWPKEKQQLK